MGKTNFIYIGPSIPQVGLKQNTLYRSEQPPEALVELMRERPMLRALYINTKELAHTTQQITRRGSVEQAAMESIREAAKKIPR